MQDSGILEAPHLVVQRQLQDVIQAQQSTNDKLKQRLEIKEKEYASLLQKYQTSLQLLEEEKISHAQTKAQLMDVQDRLDFAQGQVEVQTKQIQREKAQFEKAFGQLRNRALKETCRNTELHNHCQEVEYVVGEKSEELISHKGQIKELKQQLETSENYHQGVLSELKLQHEQELYMARLLEESEQKSHKSIPPGKSRKPTPKSTAKHVTSKLQISGGLA